MPRLITSTPGGLLLGDLALQLGEQVRGQAVQALAGLHAFLSASRNSSAELARGTRARPSRSGRRAGPRPPPPRARRRRGARSRGCRCPRSTAATAAPVAPVPEDIVSPTPRSKMRARIVSTRTRARQNDTLVRLGNSSWRSIGGPSSARSSSSRPSGTSIAHWGLPTDTCWKRARARPHSGCPSPSASPDGKSLERELARPMSTVQVVGAGDPRADLAGGGLRSRRCRGRSSRSGAGT